jgi:hypothetical protein
MNKRVREIIKMHLDTGLIELHTPITIMDLSAGEEVATCFTNRQMMKYLEREVYGYRINDRHGLQIVIKRQEGSLKEVEVHLSETEPPDPAELLMDLVEKAQMQQTIFTVLKALDEWEYPYESVTNAKNELRAAAHALGTEMDEIQKTVDGLRIEG